MKKLLVSICLAVAIRSIWTNGWDLERVPAIHINWPGPPNPPAFQPNGSLADDRDRTLDAPGPSCANPVPEMVKHCQAVEQRILASTVRLEWHVWIKNEDGNGYTRVDRTGHATIKDERYLVTHNHGQILQSDVTSNRLNTISIFTATGVPRLTNAPLNTIAVVVDNAETLVLDFGVYGGQGLFAGEGMCPAEIKAWGSLPLQTGMEVAQVTWDGDTASVAWVTVSDIVTNSGTPRLKLDSIVTSGTSGGGIFWNGYHIANTWSQNTVLNMNSETVSRRYSVAALNSPQVTARLR
jgi:hypothetical protein